MPSSRQLVHRVNALSVWLLLVQKHAGSDTCHAAQEALWRSSSGKHCRQHNRLEPSNVSCGSRRSLLASSMSTE
jgi:hypothetical protein